MHIEIQNNTKLYKIYSKHVNTNINIENIEMTYTYMSKATNFKVNKHHCVSPLWDVSSWHLVVHDGTVVRTDKTIES